MPVRPKLIRIRSDLSWGEVLRATKTQSLNGIEEEKEAKRVRIERKRRREG